MLEDQLKDMRLKVRCREGESLHYTLGQGGYSKNGGTLHSPPVCACLTSVAVNQC